MKKIIPVSLVAAVALLLSIACAAPPAPPPTAEPPTGVVIPFPEEGQQYRMSEVCEHLQAEGYEVKGTITHDFDAESFEELLEKVPALARKPLENYLSEGLTVQIEIQSLCGALNE